MVDAKVKVSETDEVAAGAVVAPAAEEAAAAELEPEAAAACWRAWWASRGACAETSAGRATAETSASFMGCM